jgi:hypothetical protein
MSPQNEEPEIVETESFGETKPDLDFLGLQDIVAAPDDAAEENLPPSEQDEETDDSEISDEFLNKLLGADDDDDEEAETPADDKSAEQAQEVPATPASQVAASDEVIQSLLLELQKRGVKVEPEAEAPKPKPNPLEFVNDDTLAEAITDPRKFNEILSDLVEVARTSILQSVQPVITAEAARVYQVQQYSTEFYRFNKDLVGKEPIVEQAANDLLKKDPSLTPAQLFASTAALARKRLGTQPPDRANTRRKPGFAVGSSANAPTGGTPNQTEAELNKKALLDTLGIKGV